MQTDRLQTYFAMNRALRAVPMSERRALGREVAEVFHAAPPGENRVAFVRQLLNRVDAGRATYADRIILDACSRQDVLRLTVDLLEKAGGRL